MLYDHRLDAFVAAAECGSFTKAAAVLHITPAALIKQVGALERETRLVLFDRSPRGAALTPAGEALYEDARFMMRYSTDALRRARQRSGAAEGLVRLGVSVLRPGKPVLDRWQDIHAACPDLRIELVPISDDFDFYLETIRRLGEEVDVVASTYAPDLWGGVCRMKRIADMPMLLAVSRKNPLAQKERLALSDLRGQTVTIRRRGNAYVDAVRDALEDAGVGTEDADDYTLATFNECAERGGILQTTGAWDKVHPMIATLPVDWDLTIPYALLYPLDPSDAVQRFVDCFPAEASMH